MKLIILLVALCVAAKAETEEILILPIYTQPDVTLRSDLGSVLNNTEYAERFLANCPNDSIRRERDIRCDPTYRYRSLNGVCNNLEHVWYGAANTPFNRIQLPHYDDGYQSPRRFSAEEGQFLPNVRDIARNVSIEQRTADLSALFIFFGQFSAHDVTLTPTAEDLDCNDCTNTDPMCFNFMVGDADSFMNFRECMPFRRNFDQSVEFDCPSEYRNQFDGNTHFLDSSNVYGSNEEEDELVRLYEDGLLKFSDIPGSNMESLPIVDITKCPERIGCFVAGDERSEENTLLTAVHTLFMRNHNLMAREYKEKFPFADDETIYQEIRRINNAIYQHIFYNEWLSMTVGIEVSRAYNLSPLQSGYLYDYDNTIVPNVFNEYQTSAGRLHTFLHEDIHRATNELVDVGTTHLTDEIFNTRDAFFNFDLLAHGLLVGPSNSPNAPEMSNSMNNRLFENFVFQDRTDSNSGLNTTSVTALNMQRARDHGTPSYNSYRAMFGLKFAETFDDLSDFISPESIEEFKRVYMNVNDIDLFYGMISEFPVPGGLVGPTQANILAMNFHNLKFGDRFYYENGEDENLRFTLAQLDNIRHISMASIVCQNYGLDRIQKYAFQLGNQQTNPSQFCNQLEKINLDLYEMFRG